ncbi:Gypsy retrotransposon integrase-like protein 1 [Cucumis melo var. makuwa]|uniref:Gypsy retrotransposon integrase-like protein 1 n=1 Tax=Cucumis melo var. makuwa TaxID=1194695 RepID=A0A5A7UA53_CUCMM|nr:Gypsy retrotransposon integrase-like protein 1 [Cucumis melo var. makuwa]
MNTFFQILRGAGYLSPRFSNDEGEKFGCINEKQCLFHPEIDDHFIEDCSIDYFTKWVEAASYKSVTKHAVVKFIRKNIICRYGLPERIITDNGKNLNNKLMEELYSQFKVKHYNSTPYCPKMNGVVISGATPLSLVYGFEAVLPLEVEVSSLRVIQEIELDEAKWAQVRYKQLNFIEERRLTALCKGQLYQKKIA